MNINKKKLAGILSRGLSGALAVLLLSSCSGNDGEVSDGRKNHSPSIKAAEPSTHGVGREKSAKKPSPASPNGITICIDPGHGFIDGGCGEGIWDDGTLEKDITLAIAQHLDEDLRNLGYNTIMTHDGVNPPAGGDSNSDGIFNANERVAYVSNLNFDYFVSIHVNSYDKNPDTSGIRIYYEDDANWRKVGKDSDKIAEEISASILTEMKPDTPPITCDQNVVSYAVVRETMTAASLIETGFSTNVNDAANLVDKEWQQQLAQAIADGINAYYSAKTGDTDEK